MAERVELIIKTAGDGMLTSYRSITCGPCQQIILRFMNGDSVVFTGERFSSEEYNEYCGEAECCQTLPAINQSKESSSDELVVYATESGLFNEQELADFARLGETRQTVILTNKIINFEHGTGGTCVRPFPKSVTEYYADCFRDCCG